MRKSGLLLGVAGLFFLLFGFGQSAVINVPSEQPTIQAGIDASVSGDTVLVADGIYTGDGNRDIYYNGKAILVISENGPDSTVIDCQGNEEDKHRGFNFVNNEDATSILNGFTILNGNAPDTLGNGFSGAINVFDSSPLIENCSFISNVAEWGGAIYAHESSLIIRNCLFVSNIALVHGGAIRYYKGQNTPEVFPRIDYCTFVNNYADVDGSAVHSNATSMNI